jgi:hypothetical protein
MNEVVRCERWHRLCEALYREHRQENPPLLNWTDFSRNNPEFHIPANVTHATDLDVDSLRAVMERLIQGAVWARIAAVDLGILELVDPSRLKCLPPSIYGAEPDPFEANGFCDNPPEA